MHTLVSKPDIQDERDIHVLVYQFYGKVRQDEVLSAIFNNVIKNNWEPHLEKMCDFWSSILLFSRKYLGDPMPKHLALPIEPQHFERWLKLFHETILENFSGDVAEVAKTRAGSIARLMQSMKAVQQTPQQKSTENL